MSEAPSGAAPVAGVDRITNLDTVRGVATLGILGMNAVSYGLPEAAYFNIDAAGSETALDVAIGFVGEIVFDQKMMALFSMLFGAGIVVFADRAEVKGHRPVRLSLWRNFLLLLIGLLHTVIWEGDILVVYALCAPVLLAARKRHPRTLFVLGAVAIASSAVVALVAQASVSGDGEGLGSFWFVDGGSIDDEVGLFLIADFFLRALGMMLIGVGLFRLDIIQGTREAAYYRRMVGWGLGIGLPFSVLGAVWVSAADFSADVALIGLAPNTLATIPVAFGYLGAITLWNQQAESALHLRIRAVGRMALTNYLTQTVLGVAVLRVAFDQGQFGRGVIAGFVVAVWAVQLLWSSAWLSRFRFGPIEWVWRSATYRSVQPIRR